MLIQPNLTKQKLRNNQPVYGVISTSDDPQLAELFGLSGFDYYMLDAEHGLIDPTQAVNVVRACERTDITPLVRIGPKDPKLVLQYLDAGMLGVMMPGLESAEEVQMLVDAVKYHPVGKRGMGISRASAYSAYSGTSAPEYLKFANDNTMVIIQFEDEALLPNFKEMCSVQGVDACIIGPRDLSLNMGFPDGPNHPEVQAVIDKAITTMKDANITAGITAGTRADAAKQVARGANMILAVSQSLVFSAAKEFLPNSS
ncbi:MAG TPA: aldolase/citrate lyase family protein [Anaerolineales bacterium]|nr:aldolase/citrate lyase family protein [Anaerolineales bacterium]